MEFIRQRGDKVSIIDSGVNELETRPTTPHRVQNRVSAPDSHGSIRGSTSGARRSSSAAWINDLEAHFTWQIKRSFSRVHSVTQQIMFTFNIWSLPPFVPCPRPLGAASIPVDGFRMTRNFLGGSLSLSFRFVPFRSEPGTNRGLRRRRQSKGIDAGRTGRRHCQSRNPGNTSSCSTMPLGRRFRVPVANKSRFLLACILPSVGFSTDRLARSTQDFFSFLLFFSFFFFFLYFFCNAVFEKAPYVAEVSTNCRSLWKHAVRDKIPWRS